jgi:hypothetical protein
MATAVPAAMFNCRILYTAQVIAAIFKSIIYKRGYGMATSAYSKTFILHLILCSRNLSYTLDTKSRQQIAVNLTSKTVNTRIHDVTPLRSHPHNLDPRIPTHTTFSYEKWPTKFKHMAVLVSKCPSWS